MKTNSFPVAAILIALALIFSGCGDGGGGGGSSDETSGIGETPTIIGDKHDDKIVDAGDEPVAGGEPDTGLENEPDDGLLGSGLKEVSSSSEEEISSSSSVVAEPSSSSSEEEISSSSSVVAEPSSSSSEEASSSSSEIAEPSSSSSDEGLCAGFVEGTERMHYGPSGENTMNKPQFCDERDGQKYVYVTIGIQVWMAENLNYAATDSKCYNNTDSNCDIYGRLYNWATATGNVSSSANPSGVKGVCPSGWHLPSYAEWTAFKTAVDPNAGTKLKAISSLWTTNKGTDDYGFSALPGGYSYSAGGFDDYRVYAQFWSSSQSGSSGRSIYMTGGNSSLTGSPENKTYKFSVRCVKDNP
jgi:uncharacterized protein (TIGR02145 family)